MPLQKRIQAYKPYARMSSGVANGLKSALLLSSALGSGLKNEVFVVQ
ncbi:hypothetical protein JW756_04595 [Candidatus Woesearchaeota archaeon]|nr:hypothetical protein [Candidatus Woesearchaeota archaeon]